MLVKECNILELQGYLFIQNITEFLGQAYLDQCFHFGECEVRRMNSKGMFEIKKLK